MSARVHRVTYTLDWRENAPNAGYLTDGPAVRLLLKPPSLARARRPSRLPKAPLR
ncbi:hypothetical protein GCM10023317_72120 [Actinopolymorpha pittospori]